MTFQQFRRYSCVESRYFILEYPVNWFKNLVPRLTISNVLGSTVADQMYLKPYTSYTIQKRHYLCASIFCSVFRSKKDLKIDRSRAEPSMISLYPNLKLQMQAQSCTIFVKSFFNYDLRSDQKKYAQIILPFVSGMKGQALMSEFCLKISRTIELMVYRLTLLEQQFWQCTATQYKYINFFLRDMLESMMNLTSIYAKQTNCMLCSSAKISQNLQNSCLIGLSFQWLNRLQKIALSYSILVKDD